MRKGKAAQAPLGGTVAHGMLVLTYLSEMLTAAFDPAWLSGERMLFSVQCINQGGEALVSGKAGKKP